MLSIGFKKSKFMLSKSFLVLESVFIPADYSGAAERPVWCSLSIAHIDGVVGSSPTVTTSPKRRHYHASIVEIVSVVSSSTSSNTLTVSSEVKVVTPFSSMAVLRIAAPSS